MSDRKSGMVVANIESRILILRGQKVMLDTDLAVLYKVEVKALNQAVKRNIERFPDDFMFQLSVDEASRLRSQSVTLKTGRGQHRKYLPYAFTEQGVAMLSGVLHSKRAIRVNVEIMRTFVRIRRMLAENTELARKLAALEQKYDAQFKIVFDAIRELMSTPEPKKKRSIGFAPWEEKMNIRLIATCQPSGTTLREQQQEAACLCVSARRQVAANLKELGYGP